MQLGNEFREWIKETSESSNVIEGTKKIHKRKWLLKVTHGYHQTQIESQENIDTQKSNKWLSLRLSSHLERFFCALHEQEIDTKGLRKCRGEDIEKRKKIIGSSPVLAPTLYLKRRHNQVAKIICQGKMKNEKLINPPDVMKTAEAEMWWDQIVKTVARIEHNRQGMVFWDTNNKCCELIEISVPLDNNVAHAHKLKHERYIELISQMQRLYRGYKYSVIVITV